jgi:acetyltransferase-like isoleucine patch superfamily enzyme
MSVYAAIFFRISSLIKLTEYFFWTVYTNIYIIAHPSIHKAGLVKSSGHVRFYVDRRSSILLGRGVRFNSRSNKYNSFGCHRQTVLTAINGGQIIIGDSVGISNSTIISQVIIRLDDRTLIGGGSTLSDSDHHFRNGNTESGIHIKSDCWIGGSVLIKKNVTIAPHTIVASGSVLTKSYYLPHQTLAGVPAQPI